MRIQSTDSSNLIPDGLGYRELFIGCKSLVLRVSFYLLVAIILVFNLFPFVCALIASFRPSNDLFLTNLTPKTLNLDHYHEIFVRGRFVGSLINSAIVAGSTVLISLAFGSLCAYALGRLPFRFKAAVLYLVLAMSHNGRTLQISYFYRPKHSTKKSKGNNREQYHEYETDNSSATLAHLLASYV